MKEKPTFRPESVNDSPETTHTAPEHQHKSHESKANHKESSSQQHEQLDAIRREVGREAQSSEESSKSRSESEQNIPPNPPAKRELQRMMRQRTLNRIRKELPAPQRVLSKFIHAKPVEVISAAGEKTIARPYGLLGGGFSALIGSSLTFYMARNYGFRYNLFLFFIFFVAGYILATVLEVVVRLVRTKR